MPWTLTSTPHRRLPHTVAQVRAFAVHMSRATHYFDDVFLGVFPTVAAAVAASDAARGPAPPASAIWDAAGQPLSPTAAAAAATSSTNMTGEMWLRQLGLINDGRVRLPLQTRLVAPERLWAVVEFASGPDRGGGADYAIRMDALHLPPTFSKLSPVGTVVALLFVA